MSLAWAFLRRDATIAMSYRVSFFMQLFANLLILGLFYYVGETLGDRPLPALERYGGSFMAFLLIGIALTDCVGVSLMSFAAQVREAQTTGTLEATFMSPVRLPTILIYSSLWNYVMSAVRFLLYLVIGSLLYQVDLGQVDVPAALVIFLLTVMCFMGIGILWAGIVMLVKRGESIMTAAATLVLFVSGVLYPVELLPPWLQRVAALVPLTHALEGMRFAMLKGSDLFALAPTVGILSVFAAVLLTGGIGGFNLAVRLAKDNGSLTQY
jgi:ABC-2 type transport system permease protein